jgi:tetratricopeptide (TPR) repeat protein
MRYAVLGVLAALCPLQAASEWLKFTSPNFEMYTTAGEKEARRTLEYFEQVRDFFMRVKSQNVTTRLPVTIVAFKNQKEYKPYSPRETAAAYYTGDEQRDYIVLGAVGSEHYPVAVHEYMHLLIRHSGLKMPSWLNEGMAEAYSTIKPLGGQILMGTPPQGRGLALQQLKWIPTDRLLAITQEASEFDEKNRTSIFYSQSWLLTHMLMLDKAYGTSFSKFVSDLSTSGDIDQALQRTYGKTIGDLDRDLKAYFRSTLSGVLFDVKLQKMTVSDPRPSTQLETELTLAKLTALLRRRDEARARYAELAKAHPDNWEIYEALAHLYWRDGDHAQARENFRQAVKLNPPSWKTYWDYARFAQGEEGTVDALRNVLRLNPQLGEARLMLGFELYNGRKFQEAYDVLAEIKQITPDRAPHFFLMKAFSAVEIGKKPEARAAAESAKKYARTADDTNQANRLIDYLDRKPVPEVQASAAEELRQLSTDRIIRNDNVRNDNVRNDNVGDSESLAENQSVSGMIRPPSDLIQVRGTLQEIECLGREARVRLMAGNARLALLIRDPGGVYLRNSDDTSVNLTCGAQHDTQVVIGYRAQEDAKFTTAGDVVTLEFLKRPTKP